MHVVTCRICGEKFDTEKVQGVLIGNRRYAHHKCAPNGTLVPMATPLQERTVSPERAKLDNLIKEHYGAKDSRGVPPWVWMQIAKYKKEFQLTDLQIYYALKYWVSVQKGKIQKNNFKIIFYYIKEAEQFYTGVEQVKNELSKMVIAQPPPKTITINAPQRNITKQLMDF